MRVLTPTGKVVKVFKVEPYVEAGFELNGIMQRVTNPAKDLSVKPTGINLSIESQHGDFARPFLYVGNLPTVEVLEILDAIGVSGFYDFTQMEYQQKSYDKVVIDGGSSLPYYNETTFNDFAPILPFYEEEEEKEEDD